MSDCTKTVINGHVAVSLCPNGKAEITMDDLDGAVVVLPEDRQAVARALMGQPDEAMVERAAKALYDATDGMMGGGHFTDEEAMEEAARIARIVLNGAFGGGEQAE